jgi:hypothetical protein
MLNVKECHFFEVRHFEDIQACVNRGKGLTGLVCLKYTLTENLDTGCSRGDELAVKHGKMQ